MSCYRPLKAFRTPSGAVFHEKSGHDILGDLELPCGQCIGCRMRRASDWALRVMHEASCYEDNCFVTLTYDQAHLPTDATLNHRDFQLFLKRARKAHKAPIRFYMCGEYGPLNQRPHYHACLFNINYTDRTPQGKSASGELYYSSKVLANQWGLGNVSVQDLNRQTAGYCARYIMKKALGNDAKTAYQAVDPETGEIIQRKPEYAAMSLKPGIGATWFNKWHRDVFPADHVISEGTKHQVPKYYDKLIRRAGVLDTDQLEFKRQQRAAKSAPDQTDARRRVRETVHEARVKTLRRDL
ncbi:MAG: replication initiator protein [Microviridae sp.]|nr:MAG: replication initiator protein [Microviridae sp.]